MRPLQILKLAWSGTRRSLVKFILMSILIAVGVTVFLTVSELSRASTEDLRESIASDLGEANQYSLEFSSTVGLTKPELRTAAVAAVRELDPVRVEFVDILPTVRLQCPPFKQNPVSLYVLRDQLGAAVPFEGTLEPQEFDLCFDDQVVPHDKVRETQGSEKAAIGPGLIISPEYEQMVQLTSSEPARIRMLVQFKQQSDYIDLLRDAVTQHFATDLQYSDTPAASFVSVLKVGDDADRIRASADGVTLVYNLIGWGVLGIIGLGILVAQLMTLRDKTWLIGLSRAVGARRGDVALWMIFDVLILLVSGFALAVTLSVVAQPLVSSFGNQAFQVNLQLLRPDVVPALLGAVLLNLIIGAGYPMVKALQLDPLEVLEKR